MKKHAQLKPGNRICVLQAGRKLGFVLRGNESERPDFFELFPILTILCASNHSRHCWMLEHFLQRKAQSLLLSSRQHPNAANRIAAQLKKIVVHPDFPDFQHLTPNLRKNLFCIGPRRYEFSLQIRPCPIRARQSAPVNFPVGGKRQRFHWHEHRRDHVTRHLLTEIITKFRYGGEFVQRHDISYQPLVAVRSFLGDHHAFTNRRMAIERRFDFTQLDPEPANFYLMIHSPQILQLAIGGVLGQISASI